MKLPKGTPGKTWGAKFSPALVWFHHPPPPGVPDTRSRNGENFWQMKPLKSFSPSFLGDLWGIFEMSGFVALCFRKKNGPGPRLWMAHHVTHVQKWPPASFPPKSMIETY